MLARILASIMILVLPNVAAADPAEETVFQMRDLIYEGDFTRVEDQIARQQERFLKGEISAADMRLQFIPFGWANPDIAGFAEAWLSNRPNSPFAKIAVVWSLHTFSWNLRGTEFVRETHPDALRSFHAMQRRAWDLADSAQQDMPRLIPASDAILRLANGNGQQQYALSVLDRVMETDPNMGTLGRAIDMMAPGWGWTFHSVEDVCRTYAVVLPDAAPEPVLSCTIRGASQFPDQYDWIGKTLATHDLPHLNGIRLSHLLKPDATREEAELAFEILSLPGFVDYRRANRFDSLLAGKYGFPTQSAAHKNAEIAWARERIADEPFNPDFLSAMMHPDLASEVDEQGRQTIRVTRQPTIEEVLEYSYRFLIAKPYDAKSWHQHAMAKARMDPTTPYHELEPFRINAIVYSRHSDQELNKFLVEKSAVYDFMKQIERGQVPSEHAKAFEGTEIEKDVICPFLRAARLHETQCSVRKGLSCNIEPRVQAVFGVMEGEAKKRNICFKERTLPVNMLEFSPIEVALSGHKG